jgi:hypothetical protein
MPCGRCWPRLKADGIEIIEELDTPAYVGFKCLDPDGVPVETYWEDSDTASASAK